MLDWEQLPNKKFPMIFHAVYGKDEREEYSPSFFNIPEVETIASYLKMLLDDNVRSRRLKHLKPEMIGIISPYKRQVSRLCGRSSATTSITNLRLGLEWRHVGVRINFRHILLSPCLSLYSLGRFYYD